MDIEPPFRVSISKMEESHRTTHWVMLINTKIRPKDADIFDTTGLITPYYSENLEHAQHEASVWAKFLGVPEQAECKCIMCEYSIGQ